MGEVLSQVAGQWAHQFSVVLFLLPRLLLIALNVLIYLCVVSSQLHQLVAENVGRTVLLLKQAHGRLILIRLLLRVYGDVGVAVAWVGGFHLAVLAFGQFRIGIGLCLLALSEYILLGEDLCLMAEFLVTWLALKVLTNRPLLLDLLLGHTVALELVNAIRIYLVYKELWRFLSVRVYGQQVFLKDW